MPAPGKLYLLPVPVSESDEGRYIPLHNIAVISTLKDFIAEDAKTARRFLKSFNYPDIKEARIQILNEHTNAGEISKLMEPLLGGENMGLMSDAGCPGIADPGADIVKLAHKEGIKVIPLSGPSAIVLSIMASGFNGQNFAFNGYLPIEKGARQKRLKELENLAARSRQAQFFIETPYRNEQVFDDVLSTLLPETLLFIGKDITSPDEFLVTKSILEWKRQMRLALHKVPVVFGIFK